MVLEECIITLEGNVLQAKINVSLALGIHQRPGGNKLLTLEDIK